MRIDFHTYVGNSLFGIGLTVEDLMIDLNRLGFDRAVLLPFKPQDYHFEPENDRIAAVVKEHPDRFYGFGRVDPWRGEEAVREVGRIFEDLKLNGLFINPVEEQCPLTSGVVNAVIKKAAVYKKPVMIAGGHVRVAHPRQMEYLAQLFPHVTFVVTSGGQINISGIMMADAEEMLTCCENVIMETSGIYRRDFIERMVGTIGAGRIVFGSGMPYYNREFELERILEAKIQEDEKLKISGGNAQYLLE
jgi:predicted TIM-barrel fold metal-dependent hydrolase